jgi:hypothetical protein
MKVLETPVTSQEPMAWVLEGQMDLPVFFDSTESGGDRNVTGLFLDFSGGSGDGVLELKAVDPARINKSVWWSCDEPVLFDFRAVILANNLVHAWERSRDFVEQMLDRLTFLGGAPVQLVKAGMLYNEAELERCRRSETTEYECTTHGINCRTTQLFANPHIVERFLPSERARRALRWFRKGLSFNNAEDRFLAFYFALEAIANDIEETKEKTHRCQHCGKSTGISKAATDGIKAIILRHNNLPKNFFSLLGKTRARIVHGGDHNSTERVRQLESSIRILAAEGIALSLGANPESIRVVDPAFPVIMPVMKGTYDPASDPAAKWRCSVTDLLKQIEEARGHPGV